MKCFSLIIDRKEVGVTFIELLITVAIIGILAAIAVPFYGDYVTRERWTGAAEAIFSEAQKARFSAVSNNRSIYLVVNVSGPDWCITTTEGAIASVALSNCDGGYIADEVNNASTKVLSSQYPGATISPATSSVTEFRMPQMVVSGAQTISIESSLGAIGVTVTSGMQVDICSSDTGRYGC